MKRGPKGNGERGFSLIELSLVVALMGVLMTVVAINVIGQAAKAKKRATEVTIKTTSQALNNYNLDNNEFPATLDLLVQEKLLMDVPKDGWGRALYYTTPGIEGHGYELRSGGEDGEIGTEDDIDVWTMDRD